MKKIKTKCFETNKVNNRTHFMLPFFNIIEKQYNLNESVKFFMTLI